ncbi:MAG: type II toxin-antitoxin system RelE/ParE family toxin [Pyrinomonadaceae bacterium]
MIVSFADQATEDVFHRSNSAAARKKLPRELFAIAARKLDQINFADLLDDLRAPPGNRLEALKHDRSGQLSIRINDQYRICFEWNNGNAINVEIVDYH